MPPQPAFAPALHTAPAWARALTPASGLTRLDGGLALAAVACAHIAGLWALLQVPAVRDAVYPVAPLMVDMVAAPAPNPSPAPAQPLRPVPPTPRPAPVLAAPALAPLPAEPYAAAAPPPHPAAATPVTVAPAAPAITPPSPPPPARKQLPATAVQYLVLPPVEVPRAARRAGEHGVVWLRVVVDVHGQPAQVQVQRSSGFTRLDEQAVWAMRQARFKPQTDNGTPIEVEVTAPFEYLLE